MLAWIPDTAVVVRYKGIDHRFNRGPIIPFMWSSHTEAAKAAYWRADRLARERGADGITSELLMMSLLADQECVAYRILVKSGVDLEQLRAMTEVEVVPDFKKFIRAQVFRDQYNIALSTESRQIIQRSTVIALDELGSDVIGTEHLLLALAENPKWSTMLDGATLRDQIKQM